MSDFIKIFVGLCCLVGAFLFGRTYGEKGYRESEEYKATIKANEELNFAKSELENVKVKFQNIADGAANKKNEEILTQIMNVFLADLSLRIQDKNAFVKNESVPAASSVPAVPPKAPPAPEKTPVKPPKAEVWTRTRTDKFKALEWMVENSSGDKRTLRDLQKVRIENMDSFLKAAEPVDDNSCAELVGSYKGSVKDINGAYFGSMGFELKPKPNGLQDQYGGKVEWNYEGSTFSNGIKNGCGSQIPGLGAFIFPLVSTRHVQIYKLANLDMLAGSLYETLPNGTTKIIGSFVLNRVDKF